MADKVKVNIEWLEQLCDIYLTWFSDQTAELIFTFWVTSLSMIISTIFDFSYSETWTLQKIYYRINRVSHFSLDILLAGFRGLKLSRDSLIIKIEMRWCQFWRKNGAKLHCIRMSRKIGLPNAVQCCSNKCEHVSDWTDYLLVQNYMFTFTLRHSQAKCTLWSKKRPPLSYDCGFNKCWPISIISVSYTHLTLPTNREV